MTFDEVLAQVQELLQREKRVSYRGLKRRFALDDEYLEDLKEELVGAKRLAADEEGRFLVWAGASPVQGSEFKVPSSTQPLVPNTQHLSAERRQLTVMFCDLVGSTALSEQLDPEELREVVALYQETCTTVIQRYAGYIAQHLGDGLLVYFGYPVAHEDDAQRAGRTGLEIVAVLQRLASSPALAGEGWGGGHLQVRIGIHTGLVVIGEIGSSERREILALGETPNIAARVQGMAEPDTVVMSAVTHHLVQGLFECQNLGPQTLKGISTPVSLYRVVRESEAQSRFEVAVGAGLTPLVGREEELSLLQRRWAQAKKGMGQVVLLSGEAGIGKSRLVQTLKEQIVAEGATRIEFRCSPYHQNSAFYSIIDYLQRLLQFQREETPQAKFTKLQQMLAAYPFPQDDTVPLLAALLSLPQLEGAPPLTLDPQKQKQKTQEALVAWLMEEAEKVAVYCAWEDLHWADPSTLEVLTLFLEQIPTARVFSVLTFRPEFTPPWSPRSYLTQLTLSRLGRAHIELIVEEVTGGKALPSEVLQQIVTKTDGIPLFVEELTKAMLESGLLIEADDHYELRGLLPSRAIPSTLQDSLMARLDRLAPVKEIAQLGATLGREFSYELLRAVSPLDEVLLQQGLRQLVDAELIYQRGLPPQATYLFKHALIQDTAYQSLLKSTRQQYHQQIAQVLTDRLPETVESQPELLAHHYTEAGLREQAIPYWQRAGERAIQRSAYVEAISHFTRELEVLKTLPETPERAQQELTLQLALGPAVFAIKGYAAPEVEQTGIRARELCQQLGESPQLMPVLARLWVFYQNRGELQTARELVEQLLRLAQRVHDRYFLSSAHTGLGMTLSYMGEFTSARTHLEQALALYDPQQPPRQATSTSDRRVLCLSSVTLPLWYLGYPDQGQQKSQESLALAVELSHSFSLAFALWHVAECHFLRREGQLARERAEALITLSTEHGFPHWLAGGTLVRGGALTEQGQVEEGIVQMQQSLAAHRATGAESGRSHRLALLAEACRKMGQYEEGLSVLSEAQTLVNRTGEHYYEAELYRLRGELTLAQSGVQGLESRIKKAEECFLKAIDIARKQQARSLELRATVSLARLWQQQGKQKEAHQLLFEIYHWFTEGFGTKDLQEAKALLEELSC